MCVYDRFNRLRQGRATMPQANIMRPYQVQGARGPVPAPMALPRPTPPQSPLTANQQLSPLMQEVVRRAQASRMTPRAGQVGLPTPATAAAGQPAPEMTFGQKLMRPRTQGMLGAAAAGFEASGYQDRPVSLGQVLGRMGTAGTKAFTAAEDRIAAQKAASKKSVIDRLLAEAQYAKAIRPDTTSFLKNLAAVGIDPKSEQGQKLLMEHLSKPNTTVSFDQKGQLAYDKLSSEYAFKKLGKTDEAIANVRTIESELEVIDSLLSGGAETGRIENALIPLKQLLKEFDLLSDAEANELSTAELLQRSISRIIPNMRVAGSGSTSDYEMRMFAQAAPMFSRTTLGNRKIARGMLQVIEFNKERRRLMDDYMADESLGNGTLRGFDRWADEKQGKLFKTFRSGDPDAEEAYKKAYEDKEIKVGDLIFNGEKFVFVTKESVQ